MEPEAASTGTEPTPEVDVTDASENFEKLDRRVLTFWILSSVMGGGVIVLAALVGGALLWIYTGFPRFIIVGVWLWLALTLFLEAWWLPRRRYEATAFRLSPACFEFRSGVYWKTSVMIPISRLQHIDLLRGPLEQRLGLATLEIFTAGTRNASHRVSGIRADRALELRRTMIESAELELE